MLVQLPNVSRAVTTFRRGAEEIVPRIRHQRDFAGIGEDSPATMIVAYRRSLENVPQWAIRHAIKQHPESPV